MREQNFFRCRHCGNLVSNIINSGEPMICCGEPMEVLRPNTVEAAAEIPCDCEDTAAEHDPVAETICSAEFSEGCI